MAPEPRSSGIEPTPEMEPRRGRAGRSRRRRRATSTLGDGWGLLLAGSFVTALVLFVVGYHGSRSVGAARTLMILPGTALLVSAFGFWPIRHAPNIASAAVSVGSLGLAIIGGALDHIVPGHHFLLLLEPLGAVFLIYTGHLVLHERWATHTPRGWLTLCGGMMFGLTAIIVGVASFS